MTNPKGNKDFAKDILELKEPIFAVRVGGGINYQEIKLYLNGDCFIKSYGEKKIKTKIYVYNKYYPFIRMSKLPHKDEAVSKDGSLISFLAPYVSNKMAKWS